MCRSIFLDITSDSKYSVKIRIKEVKDNMIYFSICWFYCLLFKVFKVTKEYYYYVTKEQIEKALIIINEFNWIDKLFISLEMMP